MPGSLTAPFPYVVRSRVLDAEPLVGTFPGDDSYNMVLGKSGGVVREDGSLLLALVRGGISHNAGRAMFEAIHERIGATDNRGAASGQPRIQRTLSNGKRSRSNRTDKTVLSGIMGFYDRYVRFPYCRKTAFNDQNPAAFAACLPALREASAVFAAHAPARYAIQAEYIARTNGDFVIPGTVFTTVTLNKNFRTACHRDAGDLPEGFGVMTCYRAGKFTGGRLVFPGYRVAVELDSFDVLLFDPHEVHGNTPTRALDQQPYERVTCVHYYRAGMHYCGSAAQELELAKAHDPRQGARRMKATVP